MKLKEITDVMNVDGIRMDHKMIFDVEDGKLITKCVSVPSYVTDKDSAAALVRAMCKAAVEAERDMAYELFGDKWKENVGPGFDHRNNAFVVACMEKARMLRPDLIGALWGE